MFELYGCPNHYGVGDEGLITSIDYLRKNFKNLQMNKLPEITVKGQDFPNLKNMASVAATCSGIAAYGLNILQSGRKPLLIAGDHSAAMGSVSATAVYASSVYSGGETGLVWIDAHPDINTDATTVTGNIHGMPVAALLGLGTPALTGFLTAEVKLRPRNVVMLGLRDIDPPEADILREQGIRYYTWETICRRGLENCLKETAAYLRHCPCVHLSFDLDSMDPLRMPGVSVPVAGGFGERDVMTMISRLMARLPVQAVDIVEFNHSHDENDRTADFVSRLTAFIQEQEEMGRKTQTSYCI